MQGIGEAIKYLYQQFILRDVVAYVTPGTILSMCVLKIYFGSMPGALKFIKEIPTLAYVPIYGFLFIAGLALQNLGEVLKIFPEHKRCSDEERFAKLQEFHRATCRERVGDETNDYGDSLERTRERIEVKKYASGNIAASLVISAILIGVTKVSPNAAGWAILSIGAILVACLIRANRRQLTYLTIWEDEAIDNATKTDIHNPAG